MALDAVNSYGNGTLSAGTAATPSNGTGIYSGAGSLSFTWDRPVKYVMISIKSGESVALYIKWNATTANVTTACDQTLVATDADRGGTGTVTNPPGTNVANVAIYASGAINFNDDFYVNGWA